jgi:translocation and assembly module TamA
LNIQHETYDLGEGAESAILLYPGISLTRTRADARPFARQGYSVHADLHGGTDKLLSDTDFVRTELSAAWVQPLTQRTRFLARGGLGVLSADQFSKIPPSQRFYAGGARSVRGYGYESISPRKAAGKNIGGKYLGFASLEADWMMAGDFGAAVFFDTGDAVLDLAEFSARRSVGAGFRWRTPIGMVRIDLAHPLNYTGRNWRIEISIGPDL